jgi:hypothetical protein
VGLSHHRAAQSTAENPFVGKAIINLVVERVLAHRSLLLEIRVDGFIAEELLHNVFEVNDGEK